MSRPGKESAHMVITDGDRKGLKSEVRRETTDEQSPRAEGAGGRLGTGENECIGSRLHPGGLALVALHPGCGQLVGRRKWWVSLSTSLPAQRGVAGLRERVGRLGRRCHLDKYTPNLPWGWSLK